MEAISGFVGVAVIVFVAFSVATLLALGYYLIACLVFKRNSNVLSQTMSHLLLFGTILITAAGCCMYAQRNSAEEDVAEARSNGFDDGYSRAVSDFQYVIKEVSPEDYDGVSFLDFIDENIDNGEDLIALIGIMEEHIHDSDNIFYALQSITPEELKEVKLRIQNGEAGQ